MKTLSALPDAPEGWLPSASEIGVFYTNPFFPGCIFVNNLGQCYVFVNKAPMLFSRSNQTAVCFEADSTVDENFRLCLDHVESMEDCLKHLPAYEIRIEDKPVAWVWYIDAYNEVIVSLMNGVFDNLTEKALQACIGSYNLIHTGTNVYHDRTFINFRTSSLHERFRRDFADIVASLLAIDARSILFGM